MKDAERIAELEAALRRSELLVEQLQAQLNLRRCTENRQEPRKGRPPRWTLNDLALAYELRQEGCSWKRIAQGLGGNAQSLRVAVYRLARFGIRQGRGGYARRQRP